MGREVERQLTDTPARALLEQHVETVDIWSSHVEMRRGRVEMECTTFALGDERLDPRNFGATG